MFTTEGENSSEKGERDTIKKNIVTATIVSTILVFIVLF